MMLLASDVFGSGTAGIPVVNRLLLDAMRSAGMNGTVVSLNDAPGAEWTVDWPAAFCAGGGRLRFAVGALARARSARRSVIFVTHTGLVPVGRAVKQLAGGRLCLFLHGVEAWEPLPARAVWGLRACDLLVANSHFTLREFLKRHPSLGGTAAEVCYLPARRLATQGEAHERVLAGPPGAPRVLIVGRLWGRGLLKGQRQLISIWPRVREAVPGAELWIVGEGDGRAELERQAASHCAGDAVVFTGFVPDAELTEIYSSSDVFAMPSRGEGFGLVFAEAMARGLPCIASRIDAGSEVVVDGETGLHVDPDSADELLAAVTSLLSDAAMRRRMGEAGRQRATELFGLSEFNERIVRLLQNARTAAEAGS